MNASIIRRLAALAYEAVIVAALVLVVGFLTVPLGSPANRSHALEVPDTPVRVLSFCLLFAASALYFTWSWTGGRRTLPMKTWRIALVCADGRELDSKTALVRYFAAWIGPAVAVGAYLAIKPSGHGLYALCFLGFNFLWSVADPERQFLHDRIAGTRIVMSTS